MSLLSKTFWIAAIGSILSLGGGLYFNYATAPLTASLIILSVILMKTGEGAEAVHELKVKIGALDSAVADLTKAFTESKGSEFTLGAFERAKEDIRIEVKDSIDKMAEKMVDFENNMGQMRRTFSAAFGSLDDRIRILEPRAENVEAAPQLAVGEEGYVELRPEQRAE